MMRADTEVAAPLAMLMLQATEVCEGPREETHAPAVHRRHHMAPTSASLWSTEGPEAKRRTG